MDRRSILRLAAGAAAACPMCLWVARAWASGSQGAPAAAGNVAPHWGYEGAGAAEHWGQLQPGFRVCALGLQQSPIDLTGPIGANLGSLQVNWLRMPLRIVNNGHTIQVNCEPGSGMELDGRPFSLLQFHFHHPSEHAVDGRRHAMEVHFVHGSDSGALAVLAVFFEEGAHNAALAPIWDVMPSEAGPEVLTGATIVPEQLLPADRSYYRYLGSQTTPPCSERVIWTVYRRTIAASRRQIAQFAELFPMNARPLQPLNRRLLLEML